LRKIPGGPLYPAAEVLALLEQEREQGIQLWTRKCTSDAQRLGLDLEDLRALLEQALGSGHFKGPKGAGKGRTALGRPAMPTNCCATSGSTTPIKT
jgi:hypothetical protein